MRYFLLLALLTLTVAAWAADLTVAPVFGNGMVLQHGVRVPVWGTDVPGAKVSVTYQWTTVSTTASPNGDWRVDLPPMLPGGPWAMTVEGTTMITFRNVYIGDVWLCSGQSNMEFPVSATATAADAAKESNQRIRLSTGAGDWRMASGDAIQQFSGTGYYFGRALQTQQEIPIGLIQRAVGGTAAELWTPMATLKTMGYPDGGKLYADLIKPLQPYAIKGVIWYQGEANCGRDRQYAPLMTALITSWRRAWGEGDFPFLFVQLPRYGAPPTAPAPNPGDAWALIREAQARTLALPNTGMAIYYDVTDGNLHPPQKQVIGERLALLAGGMLYGEPKAATMSPLFHAATRRGDVVALTFTNAEAGLQAKDAPDGAVKDIFLVARDGSYKPANAKVIGNAVIVDLKGETALPDIYYAWNTYPAGNLCNAAGLPASPFRLQSPQLRPDYCDGHTLALRSAQPLDPAIAGNAKSYQVTGNAVLSAAVSKNGLGVSLTLKKPLRLGQQVTYSLPGFTGWDGATHLPGETFTVLPGHLLSGGFFQQCLIGESRGGIDPVAVLKDDKIDVKAFKPVVGEDWKLATADSGVFNLLNVVGKESNSVAFAHVYLYTDADRTVKLLLGSDDGAKVLVNGAEVWNNPALRGLTPDQDAIPNVPLKKGWNSLLFEISQGGGDWGFCARVVGEHGENPTGLSYCAIRPAAMK